MTVPCPGGCGNIVAGPHEKCHDCAAAAVDAWVKAHTLKVDISRWGYAEASRVRPDSA